MKTIKLVTIVVFLMLTCAKDAKTQHTSEKAEVILIVKGMKEANGSILFAAGNQADRQSMLTGMEPVSSTDSIVCVIHNVPVGTTGIYVFQDMNNNFMLDMENNVPIERCQNKNNVDIRPGKNRIEINLVDVREIIKKQE